jgi:uncharacterized protein (TIGR03435 family)
LGGQSRLKAGCGQNCPPSKSKPTHYLILLLDSSLIEVRTLRDVREWERASVHGRARSGKERRGLMIRLLTVSAFALVSTCGMFAQAPAARPAFDAFEVATIKPATPDSPGRWIKMQSANRFFAKNHTLKSLIQAAYNLTPRAISGGPSWIDSDRYEILAKTPGDIRPSLDEQMAMLRKLLADRFKLAFHREEKEFSIYALTVAKTGSKLKESTVSPDATPEGPPPLVFVLSPETVRLPARHATMAELASVMQRAALDRPVVDQTGLSGRYDFDLEWTPDENQFGGLGLRGTPESTKPGLFAAIQQQLGLKLEATKGPIETLVVDHAEKPGDN